MRSTVKGETAMSCATIMMNDDIRVIIITHHISCFLSEFRRVEGRC
jgi:hypothetical protein